MTITLIQTPLYSENPEANRAMLEEKISQIGQATDLIVLPEMFTTGFTMNPERMAEPMGLTTFRWMKQQAAQTGAVVTGSYVVKEGGNFFNRLLWMQPDGNFETYDKRHLFRMSGEHHHYAAGTRRLVKSWKGWRICPLICYDLRFPVWSRNTGPAFDLLLYVANWPAARSHAWNTLLQARAIENLCYVVGVNRVGTDGKGYAYAGESCVVDFRGERSGYQQNLEVIHTESLKKTDLSTFRENFPAFLDADEFTIQGVD
ncbi:MAG: amidohydrolase [Cytophagaceae bacterium]|nr:amidohydrolase [Cytophagaceae bacterium]